MKMVCIKLRNRLCGLNNNSGVTVIEIILILVVLVALVAIFKSQAAALVNKIWKAITDGASSITG